MVREIKFRGLKRSPYGDKWVEGYYTLEDGVHYIIMPHSTSYEKSLKEGKPLPALSIKHEVYPQTIGQYTGINDKNGKEIYEGDIVKTISTEDYPKDSYISDVIYDCESACYSVRTPSNNEIIYTHGLPLNWGGYKSIEVIGNIHDNPELVEGDK